MGNPVTFLRLETKQRKLFKETHHIPPPISTETEFDDNSELEEKLLRTTK